MAEASNAVRIAMWLVPLSIVLILFNREKISKEWKHLTTNAPGWIYEKWKNWGEPFLVALILAVAIRVFLFAPYKIPSGSMIPTFLVGDRIFVDKVTYRFHKPERGDIIVFKYPMDKKKRFDIHIGAAELHFTWDSRKDFVKRLAGLPGDKIEIKDGKLIINGRSMDEPPFSNNYYYNKDDWQYAKHGQIIEVPDGHYFAMGDNSAQSSDSRDWGFVPAENMVGKAFFIWWPPKRVKIPK